jgi:hypothetical protein
MSRKYCTVDNVKQYLPQNIIIEGQNPDPNPFNPSPETLPSINIEFFIEQACIEIDSALATIYDVPLKKINFGGDVQYPPPVPSIAALLASQMIWEQRLQGTDSQRSESQKEREKWAHDELTMIQNGERRLMAQRATRGNRYVRNTALDIPKNPVKDGKSTGAPR